MGPSRVLPSSRDLALALLVMTLSCTALIDNELANKTAAGGSGATDTTGQGGSAGSGTGAGASAGSGGQGGEGTCAGASECPAPTNPCEAAICVNGQCGSVAVPAGGLASSQQLGDCKVNVCDSSGSVVVLNDDFDVPFDNNDCTEDICNVGTPENIELPISTPCASNGGSVCDELGSCVECNAPSDCGGLPADDECQTRTCIANVCGQDFTAASTPVTLQTAGDCQVRVCDGMGHTMEVADNSDLPVDGLACTADQCTMGVPSNPPQPINTPCGTNGVCDNAGTCVGCNQASDCGTDTFCQTFACNTGSCVVTNTTAGTPLPAASQSIGDCKLLVCDGSGATQAVADGTDLPADDGNECTGDTCVNGSPQHPAEPINSVCSIGGKVCDGSGTCVECNAATQCTNQGTVCQSASCASHVCGLTNTPNNVPAPPSTQTAGDCTVVLCDGMGATKQAADAGDPTVDANECTDDVCMGMTPSNPPLAQGTPCQMSMGVCDGNGSCSLLSTNGAACTTGSQCLSGFCVDGVCCNAVCSTSCEACSNAKTGGSSGTCAPIPAGQDPDDDCGAQTACDGAGICASCAHQWSVGAGSLNDQRVRDVAIGAAGASVLAGSFNDQIDFGGGALSANAEDVFVAKLDSLGNHVWSQRFGDSNDQSARAVAVDPSGNVLLTGILEGSANFGGATLTSVDGRDVFVVKLDGSGNHIWSQRFGASNDQRGYGIASDTSGNVVVVGEFESNIDFGGGNLSSAGASDIFVAKFTAAGAHVWSKRFGSSDDDRADDVAIDSSGNVIVTGDFQGSVDFGGGSLSSAGSTDAFLVKLSPSGTHVWSARFGDSSSQRGRSVAIAPGGSVIVTGEFNGTINFGGSPLTSPGGKKDVFLAAFSAAGVHKWSKRFGDSNDETGQGVATDSGGNVYLTGEFRGDIDFGLGIHSASGTSQDAFVARFDADGHPLCSRVFGDSASQAGRAIASTATGSFTFVGDLSGGADFGGGTINSAGGIDVFAVRFSP